MFRSLYLEGHLGEPLNLPESQRILPLRRSPMHGKSAVSACVFVMAAALIVTLIASAPANALRICTFKGVVVDNGWRSMTVKSGAQCAEVNVGWRTKYIPNRRPCLGERIAVDFILEDGYMKATKVVSLTPLPPEAQCYPPPPPNSSVCRTSEDEPAPPEACAPSRPICSTRPPAHVSDREWSPGRRAAAEPKSAVESRGTRESTRNGAEPKAPSEPKATREHKAPTTPTKRPSAEKKEATKAPIAKVVPPEAKEEPRETPSTTEEKKFKTLAGEVVASSPKSLSIRVMQEGEAAEVMNVKVGLKTKFIPFRRPAVGEKVRVDYRQENGDKFGYTVQVVQ
jgi:hypothetical protein